MKDCFNINNKVMKKFTSIFIIIAFVSMLFPSSAIADDSNSLFTIKRDVNTSNVKVGDTFNVNYDITPKDILAQQDNTIKDIVLVIDTSGSMDKNPSGGNNGDSKLKIIKNVANNFINAFKDDTSVNIGIVDFNNIAKVNTNGLLNVSQKLSALKNEINDLSAGGGTNIGDGLRRAYYLLNNENNHNKYIIFMTDGQATFYSVNKKDGKKNYVKFEDKYGKLGYYNCNYYNNYSDANGYYLDSGDAEYISGPGDSDTSDNKCFNYALTIANQYLANSSIKTSMIGFGSDADPNNDKIARAANNIKNNESNPYYHDASDKNTVTNIYNSMQQQIKTTIYGVATFKETFDSSKLYVDPNSLPAGLTVSGNTITGKINITYTLSADKTKYIAAPVSLPIVFKTKAYGDAILGQNGDSSSVTLSVSDNTETKYFNQYTVSIGQSNGALPPTIEANTEWTKNSVPVKIKPGAKGDSDVVGIKYKLTDLNNNIIKDWTSNNSTNTFSFSIDREGQTQIIARTIDQVEDSADSEPVIVKIDRTAPTAPIISADTTEWTNKDVNFVIYGSTDNNGSGVKKYQYRIDSGEWQDYNIDNKGLVNIEGEHTIYAQAIDNVGNISSNSNVKVKIDKTKPTTPVIHPDTTEWTNKDVNFTIDGSTDDNGSGVSKYQYKIDDGEWQDYDDDKEIVNIGGQHTIYAKAIDNAGNISDSSSVEVKIDKTKPTAPEIHPDTTEWTNQDVNFTIDGPTNNNFPVSKYQYKIDNGEWQDYKDKGTVSIEGQHTIYAQAIDSIGNISDSSSVVVKIDRTKPTVPAIHLNPNTTDWVNQNINFTIDGSTDDNGSGIKKYQYKIDNGTWQDYNNSGLLDIEGQHTIYAQAIDNVGNISDSSSVEVKIDKTKPTVPVIHPNPNTTDWVNQDINFIIDGSTDNNGSGVKKYQYKIDNGNWQDYNAGDKGLLDIEGEHIIYAQAIDNAGNISDSSKAEVKIDKTKPTVPTIHPTTTNWTNQNVNFTIDGSTDNNGSGVKKYQYKIDDGDWKDYNKDDNALVNIEGQHTIYAQAIDNAGNISDNSSVVVKIDKTKPTVPAIHPATTNWTNQNVDFTIDGSTDNNGSGVKKYQYKIDDGDWKDYNNSGLVDIEGQHTIYAQAIDNAGNISDNSIAIVQIDKTKPTLSYTLDHTNLAKDPVKITISVGDTISGVDHVINPDGSTAALDVNNKGTFTVNDNGNYTFKVYDKAGNEYEQTVSVTNIVSLTLNGTVDNVNNWIDLYWNKPGNTQDYRYKVFRNPSSDSNKNKGSSAVDRILQTASSENLAVEQKTIDGTLFTLIQTTADINLQDKDGRDVDAPNVPSLNSDNVTSDGTNVNIKFNGVEDIGTNYKYFVEATGQSDNYIIDSNIVSLENKSGIKGYYVSIDKNANGEPTRTVLYSSNDIENIQLNYSGKDFYIHVVAVDKVDNVSPVATYHYDKEAPSAPMITVTPDENVRIYDVDNSHKNTSGNVTFTVGGSTDTSTPLNYEYNLDGNGWTSVVENNPVHVMGEGNHTILARVTDNNGNVSSTSTQNILIDMTAPTKPIITLNPNVADWTNKDVSFTIDGSTDSSSGLKKYQYKIDDGPWTDYTEAVTVTTEGRHAISARAVDNVGNISEEDHKGINIDKAGPSAPSIYVSPISATSKYTNEDVTFTLFSNDLLSGVKEYQYQINGTDTEKWIDYNELNAKITESGEYTIYARAIDKAGNIGEVSNSKVYIDKGPTVPTITGDTDWTNSDAIFTIDGSVDVEGNPVDYQYKIDDGEWVDYNSENKVIVPVKKEDGSSNEGIHTIIARAKDNLIDDFYSAETPPVQAKIDTTPPPKPNITSRLSTDGNEAEVTIDYPEDISGVEGQPASGLKEKKYTVDDGEENDYEGPFKVKLGAKIYVKSVDFADNSSDYYDKAVSANFEVPDDLIVPRSDSTKEYPYASNFKFNINVGQDELPDAKASVTVTDKDGNPVSNSPIELRVGSIDSNPVQTLNEIGKDSIIYVSAPVTTPTEEIYYIKLKLTSPSVTGEVSKIINVYVRNVILH